MRTRNYKLDGTKLFLITMVVTGHCIWPSVESNSISEKLFAIIYSFHMPLFVFLSGYFTKLNTFEELKTKWLMFSETLIIIMLPHFLLHRYHYYSGWYLISLSLWYTMIYGIKFLKLKLNLISGITFSILIALISYIIPISKGSFIFHKTLEMFPFFFFGYLCKLKNINLPLVIRKKTKYFFILLTIVIFIFIILYPHPVYKLFLYNTDVWTIANSHCNGKIFICCNPLGLCTLRFIIMICSSIISYTIIHTIILPEKISILGRYTLVIYTFQGIFAHLIPDYLPKNLGIELGVATAILALSILLIKKINYRYVTNPISTIYKRIKKIDYMDE